MSSKTSSSEHGGESFYYELLAREPLGSPFRLFLKRWNGEIVASMALAGRHARLLLVLDSAAKGKPDKNIAEDDTNADVWRGYVDPEKIGECYSALTGSDSPLAKQGVVALVFELRKLIRLKFTAPARRAGAQDALPLIETERNVGYRIVPGRLVCVGCKRDRPHGEHH